MLTAVIVSVLLTSFAMLAHNAFADTMTGTLQVGQNPTGIGINTQTNKIYVAISGPCGYGGCVGNTVSVANATTNNVIKTIVVGSRPLGVDVNTQTNKIYVANYNSGTVSVIDGTTDTVVSTIAVGSGSTGVGVNPNTNKIYVANYNSATVSVIDGATNNVVKTIQVGTGTSGIGVNPTTNKIYAVNAQSGTVSVIDGTTDTVVSTIAVGNNPQWAVVNLATNKIYVTNQASSTISVIDGSTSTVVSTIPVPVGSGGIGIDTATNKIYYPTNAGTLQVIDGATGTVIATDTTEEIQPDYIGVNSLTNKVYASDLSSTFVTVVSTSGVYNVPSAPQNLKATPSNSQISLSWSAPSSNGDSQITSYKIYRSTSSNAETFFAQIGAVTSYNDTTITNGKTYFYEVTAVNLAGESPQSNEASATTPSTTAPSAPIGLTATTVSSSQINLSWSAPSNSGGSTITGYKIERSVDGGTTWTTIVASNGCPCDGYLDHNLSPSTAYTYRVSAINSAGTSSPSNTSSATTDSNTTPPPPTQTDIIFHDDYSSSTGWTQLGNEITVDSSQFPNMVKFNNEMGGGGVDQERVYKQLPSVMPTYDWVLETTYEFTSSSIPAAYPVALTIDSTNPESQPFPSSAQTIWIHHGTGSNVLKVGFVDTESSGIPISSNTPYYLRLERTSSELALFVFSDPARTVQVAGSPVTLSADPTALQNLDFIQHAGSISSGPARTLTAQVTNTTIYVVPGLTNPTLPLSAPQNLQAVSGNSQVSLTWTAPSSNGGSAITGYKVYRSTSPGTETFLTPIGNVTSYSDTTVTNGQTYFYEVTAVNSAGESVKSNEARATPAGSTQPPTGLTATTVSSSQINLSWSAPSNNGGSTITGYKIERSVDGGTTWTTIVASNGCQCNGYLDSSLSPSTAYTYRVSAINSAGSGIPSNTASATTNSKVIPPPPTQTGTVFHDGYSSSTGWTQLGTEVTVDSSQFQNMVKFNNEAGGGGVDQERVYKQLPSTLPAYNWVLETVYEFTSSSIPSAYPIALTIDSSNPESQPFPSPSQAIWIHHGTGSDVLKVGFVNSESSGIPISPNTPYYLRLERTSTMLILNVFSDPARTVQVAGSPVTLSADPTALQNLDFIQHAGSISSGPARTLTAQVTNTTIYVVPDSIVLNNVQSTSGTVSISNQITISNFNAATGNNRALIVGVGANNAKVASITFGGTSLTKAVSSFKNNDAEFWYLKNPSGTGNIVVTMSGQTQAVVGAYAFSEVDQTNPIPTTSTNSNSAASSPTVSITTANPNSLVLDLPSIYGGVTLGSPTCTQEWNLNVAGAITGASSSTMVTSPSSTTCSWTASSGGDLWDDVAVEVKVAG